MGLWLKHDDVRAFKCLLALSLMYALMAFAAYRAVRMTYVFPLPEDAPTARFSEGRALRHLRRLTVDIDGRQEGRPGLEAAAQYIKGELEAIKERAGPEYRLEVDESLVSGSFNMVFLRHSISLAYRNHKNILLRIASNSSNNNDPAVLLNGHFDSPLGSTGAGDCGSCVASMLELARLVVDSNWVPPRPIIFLFNGAEELFLLGSHGFVKTHKWSDTVGAFINLEASGSGGLDLVCQSGPGSWPATIYAQAAKYPMGNSMAQDVFGVIPGDTDYRILAEDYSNIPGLDIIFVVGGYYYHTSYDTIERLLPGSIQARGENTFNLLETFSNSAMLLDAKQRNLKDSEKSGDRAIFFDYLSLFMIFYSRKTALLLYSLPVVIFLIMPLFLQYPNIALHSCLSTFFGLIKGMLIHATAIILAIVIPVVFSVLRLLLSSHAMSWFARPYLAFLMFLPCSLMGLLIPRAICRSPQISQISSSEKLPKVVLSEEAFFWGAFGLYAFLTLGYLLAGLGGGFLTYMMSSSMLISWFFFHLARKHFGDQSLKSLAGYVILSIPFLTYFVYFGGFLVQFLIEKMGMMGSLPPPYGYFVPDAIVAASVGVVTGWAVGPILPIVSRWLSRPSILQCLLQLSVLGLAISAQFFPYSEDAPKRVVLQHTVRHSDASKIVDSTFDFSVVDANPLSFLLKNSKEAAKMLQIGPDFPFKVEHHSIKSSWVALFPVSFLFSGSLKFPAPRSDVYKQFNSLPSLSVDESASLSTTGSRRVHLDLDLGSSKEVWVTVLNITGPLSNWSFADNILPAPESMHGGPPSYICRLSGPSREKWTFWLEANSSEALRVDLAVLDQHLIDDTRKLKGLFPSWADLTAFTTFLSSYHF